MQVQHKSQVTFAIDNDYKETVWCNVVLMDIGDVLFGRWWMYDKIRIHRMRENTYICTFCFSKILGNLATQQEMVNKFQFNRSACVFHLILFISVLDACVSMIALLELKLNVGLNDHAQFALFYFSKTRI